MRYGRPRRRGLCRDVHHPHAARFVVMGSDFKGSASSDCTPPKSTLPQGQWQRKRVPRLCFKVYAERPRRFGRAQLTQKLFAWYSLELRKPARGGKRLPKIAIKGSHKAPPGGCSTPLLLRKSLHQSSAMLDSETRRSGITSSRRESWSRGLRLRFRSPRRHLSRRRSGFPSRNP